MSSTTNKLGLEIFIDGACRGNPGPAAIGIVIQQDQKVIQEMAQAIGPATNNIAEYTALIYALQEALKLKADTITVKTDSELVYYQVRGEYKVKNDKIKNLHQQAQNLIAGLRQFQIIHIPREMNKRADKLASDLLKDGQTKVVASL